MNERTIEIEGAPYGGGTAESYRSLTISVHGVDVIIIYNSERALLLSEPLWLGALRTDWRAWMRHPVA